MKLAIIAPTANIEFISEHTDFDVAFGYPTMRFSDYVYAFENQAYMQREIHLMQLPSNFVRLDHYIMAARRINPQFMASTPYDDAQRSLEEYLQFIPATPRDVKLLPVVTEYDTEQTIAIYAETTGLRYITAQAAEKAPLKFVHTSHVFGMPTTETIKQKRPISVITAYPVILAQVGYAFDNEPAMVPPTMQPDWFNHPLNDKQLALAVENIKQLRAAITSKNNA